MAKRRKTEFKDLKKVQPGSFAYLRREADDIAILEGFLQSLWKLSYESRPYVSRDTNHKFS